MTENTIPQRLQQDVFRFVKIRKDAKKPKEFRWQLDVNYKFDSPELLSHIAAGGNVGILGWKGNLVIIDIDDKELSDSLDFDTFTIKTHSGKKHFYYIIENEEQRHI